MEVFVFSVVCLSVSEQNSSQTYAPIFIRFLLDGCVHRTGSDPIGIGDLGLKGKVKVITKCV